MPVGVGAGSLLVIALAAIYVEVWWLKSTSSTISTTSSVVALQLGPALRAHNIELLQQGHLYRGDCVFKLLNPELILRLGGGCCLAGCYYNLQRIRRRLMRVCSLIVHWIKRKILLSARDLMAGHLGNDSSGALLKVRSTACEAADVGQAVCWFFLQWRRPGPCI